MTLEISSDTSVTSILEGSRLDYRALGLIRNPFESIPVFSELQPVPFNNYLRHHVRRLYSLINNTTSMRPACVYLIGPSGCGKSAILRAFSQIPDKRKSILPIYTRFPLAGGIMAFFNELFRRLPIPLLELIFSCVRDDYRRRISTHIGWKLFSAGLCRDLWKSRDAVKISPQYAIKSIVDLFSILLDGTGRKRIALILDEFEHAWARFTGPQKYNWEKAIAELFHQLKSRVILVLPVLPESIILGSRPYWGMYDWEGVNLNEILEVTNDNILKVDCSESSINKCIHSIMHREILDLRGEGLCNTLLSTQGSYPTLGAAILDLHDKILAMARGHGN